MTMREIIFRGKRVDNGEWAESEYPYGTMSCGVVRHGFNHDTIGQFTGLTDKNGVKIFEGDIIKSTTSDTIGKVGYYPEEGAFMVLFNASSGYCVGYLGDINMSTIEIIGNIYDNLELIEYMDIKPAAKMSDAPAEQLVLAPAT